MLPMTSFKIKNNLLVMSSVIAKAKKSGYSDKP
jgi:hypothetical protein